MNFLTWWPIPKLRWSEVIAYRRPAWSGHRIYRLSDLLNRQPEAFARSAVLCVHEGGLRPARPACRSTLGCPKIGVLVLSNQMRADQVNIILVSGSLLDSNMTHSHQPRRCLQVMVSLQISCCGMFSMKNAFGRRYPPGSALLHIILVLPI